MHGQDWSAFLNLSLNEFHIDKLTFLVGVVSKRLRNITVTWHSLYIGTVWAVVTTNFVVSLCVTNCERQLKVEPHPALTRYPHLMTFLIFICYQEILQYALDTGLIVLCREVPGAKQLTVKIYLLWWFGIRRNEPKYETWWCSTPLFAGYISNGAEDWFNLQSANPVNKSTINVKNDQTIPVW
jgi:hypothetical protein